MKLKDDDGFLLIVFTVGLVVSSMALTTALYEVDRLSSLQKQTQTAKQMQVIEDSISGNQFKVANESGTDVTFLNTEGTFPSDMQDLVDSRFMQHYGMDSSLYGPTKNAFGNTIGTSSSSGTYSISSGYSSGQGETYQTKNYSQNMYISNDLTFSLTDLDGTSITSSLLWMGTNYSGLWNLDGTFEQAFTYTAPNFHLTSLPTGNFELRIYENNGGNWMQSVLGSGNNYFSMPISIYPGMGGQVTSAGGSYSGAIQIPFSTISKVKRQLTFNNAAQSENLDNFPVLVVLNNSWFDYTKTQNQGQDIRFKDDDGSTELDYEIETWDESGLSYIWVNVPRIDGSSTSDHIWMEYNDTSASAGQNAAATWNSDYIGVYHLNESSGSAIETINSYNGSIVGSVSQGVTGMIGNAYDFSGGYVDLSSHAANPPRGTDFGTWEIWLNRDFTDAQAATTSYSMAGLRRNSDNRIYMAWNHNSPNWWWRVRGDGDSAIGMAPLGSISQNTWTYVVGTWDPNTDRCRLYINGTFIDDDVDSFSNWSGTPSLWYIGNGDVGVWDGQLDEYRVSNVERSADWINAQYLSMAGSFITFGSEIPAT